MKPLNYIIMFIITLSMFGCNVGEAPQESKTVKEEAFRFTAEQFSDLKILRYQINGFEDLDLNKKKLLYYLYEAAYSGRDMIWDQNYKHNLTIRRTIEQIVNNYTGDKESEDFKKFMVYAKRVWFSNGIHHHYSTKKIIPEFSEEYFTELVNNSGDEFPYKNDESKEELISRLLPIMFDANIDAKRVNLDHNADLVAESANNYYENVTQKETEDYYDSITDKSDETPISYGLNSKLIKENGVVKEKVWKLGGMYSAAIEKVVYWLKKAAEVAENDQQKLTLEKLIAYYKSGDLTIFDEYNIEWVKDTASQVDVINGFIEVYGDAMGFRGAYESVVSFKDVEATKRIAAISKEAQWFEDNSPISDEHKKENVTGISAKVITVVAEAGDASPSTPIGINLPNANWIRKNHGSKSVNIANIVHAYEQASKESGVLEEFSFSEQIASRAKEYGSLADNLHTDLHEVIGHASGQINEGIGTPKETLKNYASTLEEARADLIALYYLLDKKMIEIGVMSTLDVGKAAYDAYITNGLMIQLKRIELGEQIEESHMRNRQLVAKWVYEKGKPDNIIEKVVKDEKTFFVIRDYEKLQVLFGDLMREIQRIKSEGDFEAGKALVENYGVKVDEEIHKEVLARYKKLNIAPYSGFINPVLVPVMEGDNIIDVKVEYPEDFTEQMLYYAREYSTLPNYN